jgi:hypothetical protein
VSEAIPEGVWLVRGAVAAMVVATAAGIAIGMKVGGPDIDEVGYLVTDRAKLLEDGTHWITVNTMDQHRWVPVSLVLGREVPDGAAADLRIRRHYYQVPGGAVELDSTDLSTAQLPASVDWVEDELDDGLLLNPLLLRWYDYSYWTHLLQSKHAVYAARLAGEPSRAALFRVESYYCKPEGSGCMSINYRLVDLP